MTPGHILAIGHLRRTSRWDPHMVVAVRGHLNGADYYEPLLSMKAMGWTPWERSALEAMAEATPAQRAIAWEGGDVNQAVRATLVALPDVAEAIWQGLDSDGRKGAASAMLLAGPRKIDRCTPERDLDGVSWALSHSGDPNAENERPDRPSHMAVEPGDRPLHVAARLGLFHRIEPLLAQGADPTLVNRDGDTARDLVVSSTARPGNFQLTKIADRGAVTSEEAALAALDHAILSRAATTERPGARRRM